MCLKIKKHGKMVTRNVYLGVARYFSEIQARINVLLDKYLERKGRRAIIAIASLYDRKLIAAEKAICLRVCIACSKKKLHHIGRIRLVDAFCAIAIWLL